MPKRTRAASNAIGLFDYGLVAVGSSLAVYSAGMAIVKPTIAWLFVILVLLGTLFSYFVRSLAKRTRAVSLDSIFYPLAIVIGVTQWQQLQVILPDDGFPIELMTAAWMCWALVLGSFFTWRDGSLLFQAVPSIALFGLVGCYDTYRPVTFCFFGFLACLVTLFSRAHSRAMIRQGIESGYFNRLQLDGRRIEVREDNAALYERIKAGPWRWMAGPEWALASALVIIMLSVLGAPVVQYSVRNVAGLTVLRVPQSIRNAVTQGTLASSISSDSSGSLLVGRGPNNASSLKVLEALLDKPRYLRVETFPTYTGRGWSSDWDRVAASVMERSTPATNIPTLVTKEVAHPRRYGYDIRPYVKMRSIPVPGEVYSQPKMGRKIRFDGTVQNDFDKDLAPFAGESFEADPADIPVDCPKVLPASLTPLLVSDRVPDAVKKFAEEAAKGARNDFERASQISLAIGKRVNYNLDAEAIPGGTDPVEYFLFKSREGYCDLFASAMTNCARSVGLPARYVIGYLATPDKLAGGQSYILSESDAHAWCEVFFSKVGWVIFDATENASAVDGAGRGSAKRGFWQQRWVQNAINGLIIALILVLAYLGPKLFRPKSGQGYIKHGIDRAYVNFTRSLHRQYGKRRRIAMTTQEYIELLEPELGKRRTEAATAIAGLFDRAYFSPSSVTEASMQELTKRVKVFRESLKVARRKSPRRSNP